MADKHNAMDLSITEAAKDKVFNRLRQANLAFQDIYPGDRQDRQPIHTVYGGANLFRSDTAAKMGEIAMRSLKAYAPDFTVLARALRLPGYQSLPTTPKEIARVEEKMGQLSDADRKREFAWLPYTVYEKLLHKLAHEPVEDFRIDFEDGFGNRTDEEEDATAQQAAQEVAAGMRGGTLPPFIGIRIKPFNEDLKERGARTLDIFLTTLSGLTSGKLPDNFVVMLPKVTIPEQVTALVELFELIESATELSEGSLKMEMMVETTQAVIDASGNNPLRSFVEASKGRMIATAFGTYDYTASNNITAKYQDMGHPVCDFAHFSMRLALGHTGIWLADGATNVMPVGPHRGDNLSGPQQRENMEVVHRAWRLMYEHIRHSLYKGYFQGWDLNPAQLPIRYAAVYTFFLESYEDAAARLQRFVESAARATLTGDIFDDAATGQGLLNYFLSAMNCGAIDEKDVTATGLTVEEIRTRSFLKILQGRRQVQVS